jgi:predicted house-cleaning noncanonical NTP pyrophosphatase (MazG superfamily)
MSHRDPADLQDYKEYMRSRLLDRMRSQLDHSQEATEIAELLELIANLVVAIDDAPTDRLVLDRVLQIGKGC